MRDLEPCFIGRESELDGLRASLERAIGGKPRIVLLAGEPGIGKTRTAQALADHAMTCAVLPIWGRCPEEAGAPPYWLWLQMIRRYVATHDDASLRDIVGAAGERSVLLITHRSEGLDAVDQVVALDAGRVTSAAAI